MSEAENIARIRKVMEADDGRDAMVRKDALIEERHRVAVQEILFALEEQRDGDPWPDERTAERLLRRVLMICGTEISNGS